MADRLLDVIMRDLRLDDRRRSIVENAADLACRETYLARRETFDDGARVVFDCQRGEIRVIIEMTRQDRGEVAEAVDLRIIELDLTVFHLVGERRRTERGHNRVIVAVRLDIKSYWEAILRYIP